MTSDWYGIRGSLTDEQKIAVESFYVAAWEQIKLRENNYGDYDDLDTFERGMKSSAEVALVDLGMVYIGLGDVAWDKESVDKRETGD